MDYIYVMVSDNAEWEDFVIYQNQTEEDIIKISKIYPNNRIEIFAKNNGDNGYTPTYNYYKNGVFYAN